MRKCPMLEGRKDMDFLWKKEHGNSTSYLLPSKTSSSPNAIRGPSQSSVKYPFHRLPATNPHAIRGKPGYLFRNVPVVAGSGVYFQII